MSKIRLVPRVEGEKDDFEVYAIGSNRNYPIGRIWYDIIKKGWILKPYFLPLTRDELKKERFYDDSMKAARMLKKMFLRADTEYYTDDLDIGIEERIEDTEPLFQIPLFGFDDPAIGSD